MRTHATRNLVVGALICLVLAAGATWAQIRTVGPLVVGEALSYRDLVVFPVRTTVRVVGGGYLTLEEALAKGVLIITEAGEGNVNQLLVTNTSDHPIYIMAGTVIIGGKQDRTIQDDVIILPHTKKMPLPVYCVEHGRWHGETTAFGAAPGVANLQVRKASQVDRSQQGVWDNVAKSNEALGTKTETGTYRAILGSGSVQKRVSEYVSALRPKLLGGDDVVGCVVAVRGKLVAADVFADPALFRHLWPKLLESYATEAMSSGPATTAVRVPSQREAQAFLDRGAAGQARTVSTANETTVRELTGKGVVVIETKSGAAAAPVHQSFFAR